MPMWAVAAAGRALLRRPCSPAVLDPSAPAADETGELMDCVVLT